MSDLKEKVIKEIKKVYDPEIPVNIYELGLIYKIEINEKNVVKVDMTLTSPNCPVAESLPNQVKEYILKVKDISFEGEGCAISMASASIMTETIKGKEFNVAKKILEHFINMLKDGSKLSFNSLSEDENTTMMSLSGVKRFPMRVKCATLAWHTFMHAAEEKKETVNTEKVD